MQKKNQKIHYTREQVAEIRAKLPHSYGKIISEMIQGRHKPNYISLMVCGHRTMKTVVFEAAEKLISTMENLKSGQNENPLGDC